MTDRNQNETTFASIDMDTFFALKAADSVIIPEGFEAAYHKEMTRIENEMDAMLAASEAENAERDAYVYPDGTIGFED